MFGLERAAERRRKREEKKANRPEPVQGRSYGSGRFYTPRKAAHGAAIPEAREKMAFYRRRPVNTEGASRKNK